MIDIHAHFAGEGYDFPAEWERIVAAGVKTVVLAADTLEHAAWHAKFCEEHKGAYFTVGVHPEFASACPPPASGRGVASACPPPASEGEVASACPPPASGRGVASACPPPASGGGVGEGVRPEPFTQKTAEALGEMAADEKCVAVGEIGLDYHYPDPDKAAQRAAFEAQLVAAETLGLPVQVHSRDACADTLAILREHRGRGNGFLMHCYSYGAENLGDFLELGAYFSFGGVVCFKNARRAVEAARLCPLNRILTETDSPYLSPFRGEKNTPANLPVIAAKLAEIKGISLRETIEAVRENAVRLFPRLK